MKYAILLDGGFVIAKMRKPSANDVMAKVSQIQNHTLLSPHEHFRTYFYHAAPATDELTNPLSTERIRLANTETYSYNESLIQSLETKPDVAVRLGELSGKGWKVKERSLNDIVQRRRQIVDSDLMPNIVQKGVDLRIALDIARLSLRNTVDALVVVTGDSDFVPAFKFARREGIKIYLEHLGHGIKRELKVHVDQMLMLPKIEGG